MNIAEQFDSALDESKAKFNYPPGTAWFIPGASDVKAGANRTVTKIQDGQVHYTSSAVKGQFRMPVKDWLRWAAKARQVWPRATPQQ